jgi:hypothetical protein
MIIHFTPVLRPALNSLIGARATLFPEGGPSGEPTNKPKSGTTTKTTRQQQNT